LNPSVRPWLDRTTKSLAMPSIPFSSALLNLARAVRPSDFPRSAQARSGSTAVAGRVILPFESAQGDLPQPLAVVVQRGQRREPPLVRLQLGPLLGREVLARW